PRLHWKRETAFMLPTVNVIPILMLWPGWLSLVWATLTRGMRKQFKRNPKSLRVHRVLVIQSLKASWRDYGQPLQGWINPFSATAALTPWKGPSNLPENMAI